MDFLAGPHVIFVYQKKEGFRTYIEKRGGEISTIDQLFGKETQINGRYHLRIRVI